MGDALVILPHEICPADGVVVEGHGLMDESYLTGEPFEMAKAPGSEVLSGAINGEASLIMVASRLPVDSRYARIVRVMGSPSRGVPSSAASETGSARGTLPWRWRWRPAAGGGAATLAGSFR